MRPDALALIPARAGSKRIARKNTRPLGGKPLIGWTFEAAKRAKGSGKVLVSTDDEEVAALAVGAGLAVLHRPADLAGDHATSVDVALHALDYEKAAGRDWPVLCLLQPTSPFRAAGRIDEGLALLGDNPQAASVIGAIEPAHHPLHCMLDDGTGGITPVPSPSTNVARSQDLPRAWAITGSFYAIRAPALREHRAFVAPPCLALECDAPGEAIDIDWPDDLERAQQFLDRQSGAAR